MRPASVLEITEARRPNAFLQWLGVMGVLLGAASILPLIVLQTWWNQHADTALWRSIDGPPCASITTPGPGLLGHRPMKTFTYQQVGFGRKTGHVYCAAIDDGGAFAKRLHPVCQFTGAALISVSEGGATRYFVPPAGRMATVKMTDAGPTCVIGGWFRP